MVLEGFHHNIKPLELLTNEQITKLHQETISILQDTGVVFEHEKVLRIFEDNGCQVDYGKKNVKIPENLIIECLKKCSDTILQRARDPKNTLQLGRDRIYACMGCGMDSVDLTTWERVIPTRQDQDNAVKVIDALNNIHTFEYGPYHNLKDVHPLMVHPIITASVIKNSTKTGFSGSVKRCEIWNIKMAKVTGQQLLGLVSSSSPLTFGKDVLDAAFAFAEADFPVNVDSGVVYGATGPVTLAGSTNLTNAELLAGVVMMQLIKPGIELVVSTFPNPLEMRYGIPIFGGIERAIHGVMFSQIWRRYNLPTRLTASYTSGKIIDYQAGYEKSIQYLLTALSGCNIITLAGSIYGELTHHPIVSILDNDIAGMVGQVLQNVEIKDDTLATDLIKSVGAIPGHYLNKDHTRRMWKNEYFIPEVADRLPYPVWIKEGKKHAFIKAKEKYEEIVSKYEPIPLPTDQNKEIDSILKEAEEWYKKRNMW